VPDYPSSVGEIRNAPGMPHVLPAAVLTVDKPWDMRVGNTGSIWPAWLAARSQCNSAWPTHRTRSASPQTAHPTGPSRKARSQGSLVAEMLAAGAHYVKAFGTLGADSLANSANRTPRREVLFYATDDDRAAAAIERLITVFGFDPVRAGEVSEVERLEVPDGDLHRSGGPGGKLLDADQAQAAVAAV
jgi:hypothetical protein